MIACSTSSENNPKTFTYTQNSDTLEVFQDEMSYSLTHEGEQLIMQVENGFIATDINSQTVSIEEDVSFAFEKI